VEAFEIPSVFSDMPKMMKGDLLSSGSEEFEVEPNVPEYQNSL
jgi:hypothetical protein